jgi:hypothetical protein
MPKRAKSAATPLRQYSLLEIEAFLEASLNKLTGEKLNVAIDGIAFDDKRGGSAELRLTVRS